MRTHTIDNTTIEYPDQIGFCFNPVIINILGGNYQSVTATVTDTTTATSDRENRATFGGSCFFDLSFYTQSYFDEYREVDYKSTHAEDSKLGRLFSIELDMYNESGTLENITIGKEETLCSRIPRSTCADRWILPARSRSLAGTRRFPLPAMAAETAAVGGRISSSPGLIYGGSRPVSVCRPAL